MPLRQEGILMTKKLAEKIKAYRTVMSIIREMLNFGIITTDDYAIIDTKIAEKYGVNSSTIFR